MAVALAVAARPAAQAENPLSRLTRLGFLKQRRLEDRVRNLGLIVVLGLVSGLK